jgi:hypothetical protein
LTITCSLNVGGKSIKDEHRLSDLDLTDENKLYFKDLGMKFFITVDEGFMVEFSLCLLVSLW